MRQVTTILAAPSILGLRPTGVEKMPERLLSLGLSQKLMIRKPVQHLPSLNDRYSNTRRDRRLLNEERLLEFSLAMQSGIQKILAVNDFPLVLGGDCSILIGVMAALKSRGPHGLIFLDAHADFYLPEESLTGEAADTELALITGRGSTPLNDLHGLRPYVKDDQVFHIGQRDAEEAKQHGSQRIQETRIHCYDYEQFQQEGLATVTDKVVRDASALNVDGYWLHFDTDVVSDDENPAVDYRLAGGFTFDQTAVLLQKLLRSLPVIGITVAIFNPVLDVDGTIAPRLVACLERALVEHAPVSNAARMHETP